MYVCNMKTLLWTIILGNVFFNFQYILVSDLAMKYQIHNCAKEKNIYSEVYHYIRIIDSIMLNVLCNITHLII